MKVLSLFSPTHLSWFLSALFAASGAWHIVGVPALREAYARWQYPNGFREVTGSLLLLAGIFLAFPLTRLWGVGIAALVMFLSATTLLNHRQYTFAAPVIAVLFALIPAAFAGPV